MKLFLLLAFTSVAPLLSAATGLTPPPPPPIPTNAAIVKLSLNRDGTANIVLREKGADGHESLIQMLYSCRTGQALEKRSAGEDLLIHKIAPFPEKALRISASRVVNGKTNDLCWIVTEVCDLIPIEAFGGLVPAAVSRDGKVVVTSLPPVYTLNTNRVIPQCDISKTAGYVYDGHKFHSIAGFVRDIETEQRTSFLRRLSKGTLYAAFSAVLLLVLFTFYRAPIVKRSA